MPKDKDSKKGQDRWLTTVSKYQLDKGILVLKEESYQRIVPRSQYYPLMYTFYNDLTVEYLKYKKVLQKLSERYY